MAANKRVLALGLPEVLSEALEISLISWRVDLVRADLADAGAAMPGAAVNAKEQALENSVDAVVWLSKTQDGSAIWVYDLETDRAVARPLIGAEELTEETAAEVALTVKTLLRHTLAAPVIERLGGKEAVAQEREKTGPPVVKPQPARPRAQLSAWGGVRFRGAAGGGFEPRLNVSGSYWLGDWFGVGAMVRVGPGVSIDEPAFSGRYSDTSFGLAPVFRMRRGRYRVQAHAGIFVHRTAIDGAAIGSDSEDESVQESRFNSSADLNASARIRVAGLDLGAYVAGSGALRRQRYLVRGQAVFLVPRIELEFGMVGAVSF